MQNNPSVIKRLVVEQFWSERLVSLFRLLEILKEQICRYIYL